MAIFTGMRWNLKATSIYISLMSKDVEHLSDIYWTILFLPLRAVIKFFKYKKQGPGFNTHSQGAHLHTTWSISYLLFMYLWTFMLLKYNLSICLGLWYLTMASYPGVSLSLVDLYSLYLSILLNLVHVQGEKDQCRVCHLRCKISTKLMISRKRSNKQSRLQTNICWESVLPDATRSLLLWSQIKWKGWQPALKQ